MKKSDIKSPSNRLLGISLAAALVAFGSQSASAVDISKADNNDALNLTSSWIGGVVPGSADRAVYNLATARTNPLGADLSWLGIRHSGTTLWTISATAGAELTLGAEGITMVAGGSNSLTINADVIQSVDAIYAPASNRNIVLGGTLSGSGNISASGAGVFGLNGNNTGYAGAISATGTVVVSAGSNTALGPNALTLGNGTALNAGGVSRTLANDITLSGGTVKLEAVNTGRNLTLNGLIDGAGAVSKTGTGAVTLTGANTYLGGTTVTAGTLLVSNTTGSGTGAGAVVANGGTLGGVGGTISGATTINANATLAPGTTAGTVGLLSFGSTLSLSNVDSKATFDIATGARGVDYDAVDLTGQLTYGGDFTLAIAAPIANGTYDLFSLTGGQTGNFDTVAFSGGIYTATFSRIGEVWTAVDGGGQTFSFDESSGDLLVVPEPSTGLMLMSAMGFSLLLRRRSRTA
jgi:autotransporter-associated beta strand protein